MTAPNELLTIWHNINSGLASFFDYQKYKECKSAINECRFDIKLVKKYQVSTSLDMSGIDELNERFSSLEGHVSFHEKITEQNFISIKSPFNDSILKSKFNYISGFFNFIRFDDEEESFYIIQGFDPLCGIYFPKRSLLVSFNTFVNVIPCRSFIVNTLRQLPLFYENYLASENYNFGGYFVSHARPWHYFYNVLPGLINVQENVKPKCIITRKGGDFFPVPKLFEHKLEVIELHSIPWLKLQSNKSVFCLNPGIRFTSYTKKFEDNFVSRVKMTISPLDNIGDIFNITKPTIWIGFQGQKRSWLEQVEGLFKCVAFMAEKNEGLNVIVDGWTSPINSSESDIEQIELDNKLCEDFKVLCKSSEYEINIKSIIGESAYVKMQYAAIIDKAITNYATGSLYTARFYKKSSLCHLNKVMNKEHHFHEASYSIPDDLIVDIENKSDISHYISYSICPQKFLNVFKSKYNNDSESS